MSTALKYFLPSLFRLNTFWLWSTLIPLIRSHLLAFLLTTFFTPNRMSDNLILYWFKLYLAGNKLLNSRHLACRLAFLRPRVGWIKYRLSPVWICYDPSNSPVGNAIGISYFVYFTNICGPTSASVDFHLFRSVFLSLWNTELPRMSRVNGPDTILPSCISPSRDHCFSPSESSISLNKTRRASQRN